MTDTGGKFALGLRGFPTPDETGIAGAYLLFLFGDNPAIAQTILGALEALVYPDNWYLWGDMSADDAAEYFRSVIEQAPYNKVDAEVQAPFWQDDSGDDADDQATPDTQDWYGTWDGETFVESLAYVYLTNFLSTLITPTAAIKFLTIPRAFRVAIRQNPHGANLLLFLDGGLYKLINGYSPVDKVVEFLIASPGTEMMLVVDSTHDPSATPDANGNYVVDVVRKRLSEDEVTNPNTRYYGTPPAYQTSYDDGTTWVDTPSSDVRHASFASFPHLTPGSGVQCDTAERMKDQLKDSIDLMCSVGDAAQAVTGLLELILLPTGLVGALLSLFFTICDWIIDNGQATILAAFTSAVYDDIKCQLYCNIEADGSITQEKLDIAWEEVKALHPGTVATVIDEIRFLFTDVIFTNAGIKRTETGDCSSCDCGWCIIADFTTGTHGFTVDAGTQTGSTGIVGEYQTSASQSDAGGHVLGMDCVCTYLKMVYTKTNGDGANNVNHLRLYDAVGIVAEDSSDTTGTNIDKHFFPGVACTRLYFDVNSGDVDGGCIVVSIEMHGTGTKPSWGVDCP